MTDWKVGDRVQYLGCVNEPDMYLGAINNPDNGTVTSIDGNKVWARWDSDGRDQCFYIGESRFTKTPLVVVSVTEERQAIALLLSLGYALKKG